MSIRVFLFCETLALALLSAQAPLPQAPGATIHNVSVGIGRFSEPGIAIDPKTPSHVVAVWQGGSAVQGRGGAAYSTDSGRTFRPAQYTQPSDWRVVGDVTTAFDNHGHAFWCYLAFDRLGTTAYWAHNVSRNGIFVRRSLDGGKSWNEEAQIVWAFPTGHERKIEFEDEPRIFADNGANSRFAGNLYVGWVEWQIDKSVMLFSRSTDDGKTWSPAMQISTHPGLPRDDNGSLGGFVQAIAPDGTIYAAWDDGNSIMLTESIDGGKSFSHPQAIVETGPPYFGEVPGVSRVEGFPQIAIDCSHASYAGRMYIAWSDYRNGDVDVFIASSTDRGRTWSAPIRVNSDPKHNGKDQFYQWMTVDPITGAVYLVFYDRRDDPQNRKIRLTVARSVDGGRSFANYSWTRDSFDGRNAFLGDYTWLAAYNDRVYGAWTETAPEPPQVQARGKRPARHEASPATMIRVGVADFSAVR